MQHLQVCYLFNRIPRLKSPLQFYTTYNIPCSDVCFNLCNLTNLLCLEVSFNFMQCLQSSLFRCMLQFYATKFPIYSKVCFNLCNLTIFCSKVFNFLFCNIYHFLYSKNSLSKNFFVSTHSTYRTFSACQSIE